MAGRRLLLVHLFLPDTLDFQAWPDEQSWSHYRVPSQVKGDQSNAARPPTHEAPSSPPLDARQNLSVEDLDQRLKRASLGSTTSVQGRHDDKEDDDSDPAMSDSDAAPLPPAGEMARRTTRSNRNSFSEQNKKVSMTSLMSEAASGGTPGQADKLGSAPIPTSVLAPRSRRGSSNAPVRPVLGERSETRIPVAPASDHGRSAPTSISGPGSAPTGASGQGITPRSRRGSTSAGSTLPASLGITPASVRERQPEGAGTRTPGARAGGKAGMMTPLSIIGDLAAKQFAIPARQLSTPGDTDRHHPFGSGAVTPMREASMPGTGSRTPGPRPPLASNARSSAAGLTLTKVNENNTAQDRSEQQPQQRPTRPSLNVHNRATEGAVPTSLDNWFINEHGRGADAAPPQPKPTRPGLASRQPTQHSFKALRNLEDDNESHTPFADQRKDAPIHTSYYPSTGPTGPPAAPSANWIRAASKGRSAARQSMVGRRPSSIGGRSVNRRASIETFGGDDMAYTEAGTPVLPPYDFVPNPSSNGGLVNAVKSLTEDRLRGGKLYIGTPGVSMQDWAGEGEKVHISQRMRRERDSVPVWVDDDTFEGAYAHFCKQILWPTFHYTLPTRKGLEHEHEGFECYRQLNRRFAQTIVSEYKEGDIIFINDYHLLLVPEMVREKLPHSKICFFLHIAWPSSEIFRCLTARTHILKGMLGADLVGFQTQNFARHFRQTVSRILQLEATPKGIQIDGRGGFVTVATFPIGIDVGSLNQRRAQADVGEWVDKLRSRYEGKKVIVGRDKLDSIKGVRQKLLAFETALDEHPDLVGKIVLLQVALATTEENEEVAAATDVVSRINNKYSSLTYQPVVFLHVQDITFCQYLALLTVADAFLATSLREGMNLTSHEFIICQEVKHKPLILSEFTGTYSSLRACIGINPWNTKQVADAIYKAITMDEKEAVDRWKDLHRQVIAQDAQHWIQSLLGRLERAHIDQQRRNNSFVPRLEIGQSEWRASKSRLILLDLEGTLMQDDPLIAYERGFEPPESAIKVLNDLTEDPKNRVYVLSGKGAQDLDKLVARVPCLGLVAENGCSVMYAGSAPEEASPYFDGVQKRAKKSWTSLVAGTNMSWRGPVKEILTYFTERTPGSWLEDRGASILWRFWSQPMNESTPLDKEFQWARRQAAEVQNLIYDSLGERFSLRIIPGKTSFLIMPKNTSRASAVQHIISLSHVGVQHTLQNASSPAMATETISAAPMIDETSDRKQQGPITGAKGDAKAVEKVAIPSALPRLQSGEVKPTSAVLTQGAHSFRQPSNAWSFQGLHEHNMSNAHQARAPCNTHMLHPYGLGSFDLVLCIGQDDNLFAYINSLDLSFAPITCTSFGLGDKGKSHGSAGIGSEANYYVDGTEDVLTSLTEILAFRGRDQVSKCVLLRRSSSENMILNMH